jgi:chitinase
MQAGWTVRWINEQQVPYTFNGNQWIGYENINSVKAKVLYNYSLYPQKGMLFSIPNHQLQSVVFQGEFARQQGLGGVMVYALEMDDFRNVCGNGNYPLVKSLKTAFGV